MSEPNSINLNSFGLIYNNTRASLGDIHKKL